jgi:hypothetical protein
VCTQKWQFIKTKNTLACNYNKNINIHRQGSQKNNFAWFFFSPSYQSFIVFNQQPNWLPPWTWFASMWSKDYHNVIQKIWSFVLSSNKFNYNPTYRDPSLGFVPKARACESVGQKWSWKSHFMLPGMRESVREWTTHSHMNSHFES